MNTVSELIRAKGHQVHGVPKHTSIAEVAQRFLDTEVGSFLVYDGEQVVGIFTKNDLVRCYRADKPASQPVGESMSRDLFTTPPDADLEGVFHEMLRRGLRHVPVMDNGLAVGMITPIDILLHQKSAIRFENEELTRYIQGSY